MLTEKLQQYPLLQYAVNSYCSTSDLACICKDKSLIADWTEGIKKNCNEEEQARK